MCTKMCDNYPLKSALFLTNIWGVTPTATPSPA